MIIICVKYAEFNCVFEHENGTYCLKRQLLIEKEICIAQNQEHKFTKFNPELENL